MFHQGSSLKKMSLHYSQIKLISTAGCLLLKSLPELTEKSCNPVSAKCWLAPFCFFCYPEICIDTSFLTSNSMFSKQHSKYKLQLCVLSHPVMLNSVTHRLLCLWDFPARILELVVISSSEDLLKPGIKPAFSRISCIAGSFFTTEPLEGLFHFWRIWFSFYMLLK